MQQHLSENTLVALLKQLHRFAPADLDIVGVTQEQIEQLAQEDIWVLQQVPIVMQTFRNLIFSTANMMGYPSMVLPTEYIAPHVHCLIAPGNRMMACIWLYKERNSGAAAGQLSQRGVTPSEYEFSSPDSLFAMVCQCADHDRNGAFRTAYRAVVGLEIEEAMKGQPRG